MRDGDSGGAATGRQLRWQQPEDGWVPGGGGRAGAAGGEGHQQRLQAQPAHVSEGEHARAEGTRDAAVSSAGPFFALLRLASWTRRRRRETPCLSSTGGLAGLGWVVWMRPVNTPPHYCWFSLFWRGGGWGGSRVELLRLDERVTSKYKAGGEDELKFRGSYPFTEWNSWLCILFRRGLALWPGLQQNGDETSGLPEKKAEREELVNLVLAHFESLRVHAVAREDNVLFNFQSWMVSFPFQALHLNSVFSATFQRIFLFLKLSPGMLHRLIVTTESIFNIAVSI